MQSEHVYTAVLTPHLLLTSTLLTSLTPHADHITMKLQSVLNGRENDVSARKAKIHRKLAKHVNKACNARYVLCNVYACCVIVYMYDWFVGWSSVCCLATNTSLL